MKKLVCALLVFCMTAALVGYGNTGIKNPQNASGSSVSSAAQQSAPQESKPDKGASRVDVDLTTLSSTMVYAEVYNMLTAPETYIGRTVRMNGSFSVYHDENTDKNYFACIIADATACCQQGLEFVLAGGQKYPEDYPEVGTQITVVGEFQTYTEGQYRYCQLTHATME